MATDTAIAWRDLTVGVNSLFSRNEKVILNSISGKFEFNRLNALMGCSGSGKTTLFKCLNASNKYRIGSESKILVNNSEEIIRCFIYQDHDRRIMTGLSVFEALVYSSKLKNSRESGVDHKEVAEKVMTDLMIADISDNRIEKCSGGQIKRICIGLELTAVKKPNLMFIDEPTTGLDSNAAEVLVDLLKALTRSHRMSIIASIHQPNQDLFYLFDTVYVLAKGGVCVFTGRPSALPQHMRECNIPVSDNQVPIEVVIKLSFNGLTDERVKRLSNRSRIITEMVSTDGLKSVEEMKPLKKSSSFKDFWHLLCRYLYRNYVLDWPNIVKYILIFVFLNIFIVECFSDRIGEIDGCFEPYLPNLNKSCVDINKEKTILTQNQNYIYISNLLSIILLLILFATSFVDDFIIFLSERQNCWYGTTSFFLAKGIVDTVMIFFYSLIYSAIIIIYQRFDQSWRIYYTLYVNLMTMLCTQALGPLLAIMFNNNRNVVLFMALAVVLEIDMFNNFMFINSRMPTFFRIISEFDYCMYFFNSMLILIYGLGRCPDGHQNKVLIEFGIEDDRNLFDKYFRNFLISYVILIVSQYVLIHMKVNNFYLSWFYKRNKFNNNNLDIENTEMAMTFVDSVFVDDKDNNNNIDKEVTIAWFDLSFSTQTMYSIQNKLILDDINGHFESHTINAIMGPSGAGKTTLLKCLNANILNGLSEESKVLLSSRMTIKTAFIPQNCSECLMRGLTVRETLVYASRLKNSRVVKELDHNVIVSDLMAELLISDTADNKVESCSGGEQKRIVVAAELTSHLKPNLLFIDEPTSGLDSNAAEVVIQCFKKYSQSHRISIICSIHQPNQELFNMFHNIYVLAKGGVNVYSGPPSELRQHLNDCNIKVEYHQVPIEVLLKVSSEDKMSPSVVELKQKMNDKKRSQYKRCLAEDMLPMTEKPNTSKMFSFKDFFILLQRTMIFGYRCQFQSLSIQILFIISLGFLIRLILDPEMITPAGCLEFDLTGGCNQTMEEIRDEYLLKLNIKAIMCVFVIMSFIIVLVTAILFGADFKVFLNQQANGWYSTGAYFWTKNIVDFLPMIPTVAIFCQIVNFYGTLEVFLMYFFFNLSLIVCCQSVGQISGILYPNDTKLSLLFVLLYILFLVILSNTMIFAKEIHYFLQFLTRLNPLRLVFDNILILIYGFDRCPDEQLSGVLYNRDIDENDFWSNITRLILLCILYKSVAFIMLIIKANYSNEGRGLKTVVVKEQYQMNIL